MNGDKINNRQNFITENVNCTTYCNKFKGDGAILENKDNPEKRWKFQ